MNTSLQTSLVGYIVVDRAGKPAEVVAVWNDMDSNQHLRGIVRMIEGGAFKQIIFPSEEWRSFKSV